MKRVLSVIVGALVALSFAGMVFAVDSPSVPRETMDMKNTPPVDVPQDKGATTTTKDTKAKKKKKSTKKTRKGAKETTGPNYGTPATGGPSGTMGTGGQGNGGAGTGGAGTGGAGR